MMKALIFSALLLTVIVTSKAQPPFRQVKGLPSPVSMMIQVGTDSWVAASNGEYHYSESLLGSYRWLNPSTDDSSLCVNGVVLNSSGQQIGSFRYSSDNKNVQIRDWQGAIQWYPIPVDERHLRSRINVICLSGDTVMLGYDQNGPMPDEDPRRQPGVTITTNVGLSWIDLPEINPTSVLGNSKVLALLRDSVGALIVVTAEGNDGVVAKIQIGDTTWSYAAVPTVADYVRRGDTLFVLAGSRLHLINVNSFDSEVVSQYLPGRSHALRRGLADTLFVYGKPMEVGTVYRHLLAGDSTLYMHSDTLMLTDYGEKEADFEIDGLSYSVLSKTSGVVVADAAVRTVSSIQFETPTFSGQSVHFGDGTLTYNGYGYHSVVDGEIKPNTKLNELRPYSVISSRVEDVLIPFTYEDYLVQHSNGVDTVPYHVVNSKGDRYITRGICQHKGFIYISIGGFGIRRWKEGFPQNWESVSTGFPTKNVEGPEGGLHYRSASKLFSQGDFIYAFFEPDAGAYRFDGDHWENIGESIFDGSNYSSCERRDSLVAIRALFQDKDTSYMYFVKYFVYDMAANAYTPVDHPEIKTTYGVSSFALLPSNEVAAVLYHDSKSNDIVAYGGAKGVRTLCTIDGPSRVFTSGDSLILSSETWGFMILKDELVVGVEDKMLDDERHRLIELVEGPDFMFSFDLDEGETVVRIRAIDLAGSEHSVSFSGSYADLHMHSSGWYVIDVFTDRRQFQFPVIVSK